MKPLVKRLLPMRVLRVWWKVRPWWKCRHCGDKVSSYKFRGARQWAHIHGEAHCEAPCPRCRRCSCSWEPVE